MQSGANTTTRSQRSPVPSLSIRSLIQRLKYSSKSSKIKDQGHFHLTRLAK